VSSISLWQRHHIGPLDRAAALTILGFALSVAAAQGAELLLGSTLVAAAVTIVIVGGVTLGVALQQSGGWNDEEWELIRGAAAKFRHADPAAATVPTDVAG
jgi:Mn2+/Fe2+ NRAMP family transporter